MGDLPVVVDECTVLAAGHHGTIGGHLGTVHTGAGVRGGNLAVLGIEHPQAGSFLLGTVGDHQVLLERDGHAVVCRGCSVLALDRLLGAGRDLGRIEHGDCPGAIVEQ